MDISTRALQRALWPKGTAIPSRDITCRRCGRENEVDVASAALETEACVCGACGKALFLRPRDPLSGLDVGAYQHPLDARSLAALKAVPGFDRLVKWMMEQLLDRSLKLQHLGAGLRCNERQLPELHALFQTARQRLGLPFDATLYLTQSPVLNAYTGGVEERVVVVHSVLANELDDDALIALFGHELGHQHAEHGLYRAVAALLMTGGSLIGPLRLFSLPLQLALFKWSRCAELTCDRAGLLASRDLGAALRLLVTLTAGTGQRLRKKGQFDLAELVAQARELAELEGANAMDGVISALMTMRQTHPMPAWRVMHLLQWVEEGNYLDLLTGAAPGIPGRRVAA